ncbi:MAG: M20 metallopeptidase family protein [Oscillospiraceae bacterium]|jgi:amidohydrolase
MKALAGQLKEAAARYQPEILEHYRHFHTHPELSGQEVETSRYITEQLTSWGIQIQELELTSGVAGVLKGGKDGPCVALRADMDALPVLEESACPFPSQRPGVMHACGHDLHMAALLGAAHILADWREEMAGSVKFIFQPAEEIFTGAEAMVQQGVLEQPKVEAIFGLHSYPDLSVGQVAVRQGAMMAAVNSFTIRIRGRGGHGGLPHLAKDPVVCAAAVITSLQTVVSRLTDAQDALVVSVCSIRGGEEMRPNIIPEEVVMAGTVRAFDPTLCQQAEKSIRLVVESTAQAYGCKAEVDYRYDLLPTINSDWLYPIALEAVESLELEVSNPRPSTGGEDFSVFAQRVPGFFYWLGTGDEKAGCSFPWHNPKFRIHPDALPLGAQIYASSALHYLNHFAKAEPSIG